MEEVKRTSLSTGGVKPYIRTSLKGCHEPEELYKKQLDALAERELLGAHYPLEFTSISNVDVGIDAELTGKEIIAGSSVAWFFNDNLKANDIDVYFKSMEEAKNFASKNKVGLQVRWNLAKQDPNALRTCAWVTIKNIKYNLIWGIKYKDMEELLSGFDIRACAVGYDIKNKKVHAVRGAIADIVNRRIVWQTSMRGTSLSRLIKYQNKGYSIDKYQLAILGEILRSDRYSPDKELVSHYSEK